MTAIINHYSLVLAAAALVALVAVVLLRDGPRRRDWLILGGLVLVLAAGWLALRPVETTLAPGESAESLIGGGLPVLLEYQSPY